MITLKAKKTKHDVAARDILKSRCLSRFHILQFINTSAANKTSSLTPHKVSQSRSSKRILLSIQIFTFVLYQTLAILNYGQAKNKLLYSSIAHIILQTFW